MGNAFTELKIDKLKEWAQELAIDYKGKKVDIEAITLYKYRPSLDFKRVAAGRGYSKFPTEYAIVFDLMNYEWKNLPPEERFGDKDPYNDFIYEDTNFMDAGGSTVTSVLGFGLDKVYKNTKRSNYNREWVFLPRCKNIELTESVKVNEKFVLLYDKKTSEKENGTLSTKKEKTSDKELIKNSLKKFQFAYSDNTEIEIVVGRNDIRARNAGSLHFDLKKGRIVWDVLVDILENPPHKYDCGNSNSKGEKTEYNRKYGHLRQISEKLIEHFFNKETELKIPSGYLLFERVKGDKGVFKPMFKVKSQPSSLDLCSSKGEFSFKFDSAKRNAEKSPRKRKTQQALIDLIGDAMKQGHISEEEKEYYFEIGKEAVCRINKIESESDSYDGLGALPKDHDCVSVDNIEEYSDSNY